MDAIVAVGGGLLGAAAGAWVGLRAGARVRAGRPRTFWLAAVSIVIGGIALTAAGLLVGMRPMSVAGVAWIAAALTALKYGAGRVPGVPLASLEARQR